ncbi:unnamed protein product [Camellia sinensis]
MAKGHGEGGDDHMPNKHVKVGKKVGGKSVPLFGKNSSSHSHIVALPSVHHEDTKFQNQMNSSVICAKKKSAKTKTLLDPSPPSKVPNGDTSLSTPEEKDIDKQKTGMASSKYQGDKLKDRGEFSDPSVQRSHGKSSYTQSKSQPGKLLNNVNESDQSVQRREKDGIRERPDLNVSEGKYPMQTMAREFSKFLWRGNFVRSLGKAGEGQRNFEISLDSGMSREGQRRAISLQLWREGKAREISEKFSKFLWSVGCLKK